MLHPLVIMGPMERQLQLITEPASGEWRLDEQTRRTGRKGIEAARAALAAARRQAAA